MKSKIYLITNQVYVRKKKRICGQLDEFFLNVIPDFRVLRQHNITYAIFRPVHCARGGCEAQKAREIQRLEL